MNIGITFQGPSSQQRVKPPKKERDREREEDNDDFEMRRPQGHEASVVQVPLQGPGGFEFLEEFDLGPREEQIPRAAGDSFWFLVEGRATRIV